MFVINDIRGDSNAEREKELYKLAENILLNICVFSAPSDIGAFVKKYYNKLITEGMGELKSHHFNIAEWRLKTLLREDVRGNSREFLYKKR